MLNNSYRTLCLRVRSVTIAKEETPIYIPCQGQVGRTTSGRTFMKGCTYQRRYYVQLLYPVVSMVTQCLYMSVGKCFLHLINTISQLLQ